MDVLEHDPVALFVSDLKLCMGSRLDSLTKGKGMEGLAGVHSTTSGEVLDIEDWISTW
jgi:hypothetical protein